MTDRRRMLWWGRHNPDYSRNRVIRQQLDALGWDCVDFRPRFSPLGVVEAMVRSNELGRPDIVWVGCSRHRDVVSAARWASMRNIPLVFDPLISAYDKQVFERTKFSADSLRGRRLLTRERRQFAQADMVLADTHEHLRYFEEQLEVSRDRLRVVPVGAEEELFHPVSVVPAHPPEVLFYGSFLNLQGAETIVRAAKIYEGPPVRWHLLGEGPKLEVCQRLADGADNIIFEPWIDYEKLPARIHRASVLLGVFGASQKAARVIPNKVYQALACGKPLVTLAGDAYPIDVLASPKSGIRFVPEANAEALSEAVRELVRDPAGLVHAGRNALQTYEEHFSISHIRRALKSALDDVLLRFDV